jgi:hypothetical protein
MIAAIARVMETMISRMNNAPMYGASSRCRPVSGMRAAAAPAAAVATASAAVIVGDE